MTDVRRLLIVLLLLAFPLTLTACGGSKQATRTPAEVMAAVKAKFDATSGVHFTLAGANVPKSGSAVLSAEGDLTRAPAFDGTITVRLMGLTPKVPVRSVGGSVWAQIPLTTGWTKIKPSDYGVPDPADLIAPTGGLSSMLTHTTVLTHGKSVRGGKDNKEILTSYTGTLPGQQAKALLTSIHGDLKATYTVTDSDELRTAVLTGDFYGDGHHETYTVTVSDYGLTKHIKAP